MTETPAATRPRRRSAIDPNGPASVSDTPPFDTEVEEGSAGTRRSPKFRGPDEHVVEEEPTRRTRSQQSLPVEDDEPSEDMVRAVFGKGRKAVDEAKRQSSSSTLYFRWDEEGEPILIRFLDADPVFYESRWVNRSGRKSFPYIGNGDPLEALGVKRTQKIRYQVVNYSSFDTPVVQIFEVTPSVDEILMKLDSDPAKGPLVDRFYEVSRSKPSPKAFNYNYTIRPVKPRDLEEDWNLDVAYEEDQFEGFELLGEDKMIPQVSLVELREVANEIMGKSS